jgi:site-specific DNA recombinase
MKRRTAQASTKSGHTSTPNRSRAPNTNAVVYVRVSSKEQEREGFSIPAQRKLLKEYAELQGFRVMAEFEDIETAKKSGRTGFGEMIAYLSDEQASCRIVLVEKTDRLYRNIRDWVTIADLDLEVHLVKEGVVLREDSRSSEKFMHGIRVLMAKNYIDNLSEEVRKGMREKAEQGYWPTVAHVGYRNNLETKRIEIDRERGPVVAKLFEWYATGDMSLKELTVRAFSSGLTHPRSGRKMTKSEIHRILHNPIYAGEFVWKGTKYRGPARTVDLKRTVRGRPGCLRVCQSSQVHKASPRVRRCGHMRPLWLRSNGGGEEGALRVLPLHRLPGALRKTMCPL